MVAEVFMIMYIAHFLGDYYFQFGVIASKKNTSYVFTFLHCLIYSVPHYVALVFLGISMNTVLSITFICLSHAFVDFVKAYLNIHYNKIKNGYVKILCNVKIVYVLDQLIHYVLTFMITYLMIRNIDTQVLNIQIDVDVWWWILYATILCQPFYVTYRILIANHREISDVYSIEDFIFKMAMLILALGLVYSIWVYILCVILYLVLIYKSSHSTTLYIRSCLAILVSSIFVKMMLDLLLLI